MSRDVLKDIGPFVKINELTEMFGISRQGLYKLVHEGKFPAGVKLGKSRRWAVADIKAWLEQSKNEQTQTQQEKAPRKIGDIINEQA